MINRRIKRAITRICRNPDNESSARLYWYGRQSRERYNLRYPVNPEY